MAIKTTGVDHIHVLVPSLDSFLELFDRLFESEHTMQSEVESVQDKGKLLAPFSIAQCGVQFLDVFEPATEDGIVARELSRNGAGLSVLSFGVEDIEGSTAHAESCGLRVVSRLGFPGVMSQVQFHPADTFGFQLEFVEYEPGAEERIAEIQRRKAAGEPVEGLRARESRR